MDTNKNKYDEKSNIFLIGGLIFTAANVVVGGIGNIVSGVFKKKGKAIIDEAQKRYDLIQSDYQLALDTIKEKALHIVELRKSIYKKEEKRFFKALKRLSHNFECTISGETNWITEIETCLNNIDVNLSNIDIYINNYTIIEQNRDNSDLNYLLQDLFSEHKLAQLYDDGKEILNIMKNKEKDEYKERIDEIKLNNVENLLEACTCSVLASLNSIKNVFSSKSFVDNARLFSQKCDEEIEKLKLAKTMLDNTLKMISLQIKALYECDKVMRNYVQQTIDLIKEKDSLIHFRRISLNKFTHDEMGEIAFTISIVHNVNVILNQPLFQENGLEYNGDMSDFNDAYQSVINARKLIKNDEWD